MAAAKRSANYTTETIFIERMKSARERKILRIDGVGPAVL
jgi:hypothetical protein